MALTNCNKNYYEKLIYHCQICSIFSWKKFLIDFVITQTNGILVRKVNNRCGNNNIILIIMMIIIITIICGGGADSKDSNDILLRILNSPFWK